MKNFLEKEFFLIVSLPKNEVKFAKAVEDAGCDAIKVHINVEHTASGTKFLSWKKEKEKILKILKSVKIPVGIMPGADIVAGEDEIYDMEKNGIDFFDIYLNDAPVYLYKSKMKKIIAVDYNFNLNIIKNLDKLKIDAIEASIVKPEDYGKILSLKDILNYKILANNTKKPVFVPTQKFIKPNDILLLKEIGIKGIMIGAIVTGNKLISIKKVTSEFRKMIDKI
jgi:hypothetical protein